MANIQTNSPYIKDWLLPSVASGRTTYGWLDAKADLEFLNQKLTSVTREVSIFDAYHIKAVVESKNDFAAKTAQLLPYESVIIGSIGFTTDDGVELRKGDVVYKQADYSLSYIQGITGGVYYPSEIVKNSNNYVLSFNITSITPTKSETIAEKTGNTWSVDSPAEKIIFENITSTDNKAPYNIRLTDSDFTGNSHSYTFSAVLTTGVDPQPIYPIIKAYWNAQDNEELVINYALEYNSQTQEFTISNMEFFESFTVVIK